MRVIFNADKTGKLAAKGNFLSKAADQIKQGMVTLFALGPKGSINTTDKNILSRVPAFNNGFGQIVTKIFKG